MGWKWSVAVVTMGAIRVCLPSTSLPSWWFLTLTCGLVCWCCPQGCDLIACSLASSLLWIVRYSAHAVVVFLVRPFVSMALVFDGGCTTEKWVLGSCEKTLEPLVVTEERRWKHDSRSIRRRASRGSSAPHLFRPHKTRCQTLQTRHSRTPLIIRTPNRCWTLATYVLQNFLKTPDPAVKANSPEAPMKAGIPLPPESRGDMPDRSPNHAVCQAYMNATSLERQLDLDRIIVVFTRTVASAHPCLVSGPSLPDLAAIAARFLPSAQDPSHSASSAPTLLDPISG